MTQECLLGIEIGGTKLQVGLKRPGESKLFKVERQIVDAGQGATGIREQLQPLLKRFTSEYRCGFVGIGFGGPVDSVRGVTRISHQVSGWKNFPLTDWVTKHTGCPAVIGNDCDVCALAESKLGAGLGRGDLLYVTIGTGIGGGLVINNQLVGQSQPAVAELGHLRPFLMYGDSQITVESFSSGWGISHLLQQVLFVILNKDSSVASSSQWELATRQLIAQAFGLNTTPPLKTLSVSEQAFPTGFTAENCVAEAEDLWSQSNGGWLDARVIGQQVAAGNNVAQASFAISLRVLGWAIAQAISLTAIPKVVIGGGVSSMPENDFRLPLVEQIKQFVFPELSEAFEIVPTVLGDEVVIHGAIELARIQSIP